MKRDMDLIRELLLAIEETPPGQQFELRSSPVPGHDMENLQSHLKLLGAAGFVSNVTFTRGGGCCDGLTWLGHDFIDAARAPSVWASARQKVGQLGGSVAIDVLKALLVQVSREQLGLS